MRGDVVHHRSGSRPQANYVGAIGSAAFRQIAGTAVRHGPRIVHGVLKKVVGSANRWISQGRPAHPQPGKKTGPNKGMRVSNPEGERAPIYQSEGKISGAKSVKQKKGENVKVSSSFRKKVGKVLHMKEIHGHFHQFTSGQPVLQQTDTGFWTIYPAGGLRYTAATGDTASPWLFTPSMFLHALSVLFNGKTGAAGTGATGQQIAIYNQRNDAFNAVGNFNIASNATGVLTAQPSGSRLKFTVKSAHATYIYKNISPQAKRLELYVCKPKKKSEYNPASIAIQTNLPGPQTLDNPTANADVGQLHEPVFYLAQQSDQDAAEVSQGVHYVPAVSGTLAYVTYAVNGKIINWPLAMGVDAFPSFRNGYTFELIKVTLQPGQEYKLHVAGPSNLEMDSLKWYTGLLEQNIQMYSRSVMVKVINELASGITAGTPENLGSHVKDASDEGIFVEQDLHIKVSMPQEAAGHYGTTTLATALADLHYRRPMYCYVENGTDTAATTFDQFNAQQPVTRAPA